jgi:hypothetical protein
MSVTLTVTLTRPPESPIWSELIQPTLDEYVTTTYKDSGLMLDRQVTTTDDTIIYNFVFKDQTALAEFSNDSVLAAYRDTRNDALDAVGGTITYNVSN